MNDLWETNPRGILTLTPAGMRALEKNIELTDQCEQLIVQRDAAHRALAQAEQCLRAAIDRAFSPYIRRRSDMTREQAIEIARRFAKAKPQSYYSEPFQPHEWVIDAIVAAYLKGYYENSGGSEHGV